MTDKPEHHHGIDHEPHLRPTDTNTDPSEAAADQTLNQERANTDPNETKARHSIYNEPAVVKTNNTWCKIEQDWSCLCCGYNLRGLMSDQNCPECGTVPAYQPPPAETTSYGTWLAQKIAETSVWTSFSTVIFSAVAGGIWAVVGAMLTGNLGVMGITVVGPITEEVMKIAIVAGTIERHPYLFRSKGQIWFAALSSAAVFAIIENLLYLHLYIPDPSSNLVLWRWTICSFLHVGCTAVAVTGVIKVWERSVGELREPKLGPAGPSVLIAATLHGIYNTAAMIMAYTGFEF